MRYASCPVCGRRLRKIDEETYECTRCSEDAAYDDDYVPVGCRACGGDYPNCKTSCPMFDD